MAKTYNVYASNSQEGSYTKIAEGITEPTINIQSPDPLAGGEKFIKVAEVNDAGEGFLSKPVRLTFIGEVPKPEILKYFYKGFFVQYKNAAYATSMSLQASVNGGEFVTKDTAQVANKFAMVENIAGSASLKTVCNGENSLRNGVVTGNLITQNFNWAVSASNVYRSGDEGRSWPIISKTPQSMSMGDISYVEGNLLFSSHPSPTPYYSIDNGLTWAPSSGVGKIFNIISLGNGITLALGFSYTFIKPDFRGIYRSFDKGATWSSISTERFYGLVSLGNNIVIVGSAQNYGIKRSVDGGTTLSNTNITTGYFAGFAYLGNNIVVAGGSTIGIKRSTDGGITWQNTNVSSTSCVSLVYIGNNVVLALTYSGDVVTIMRSIDNGMNWGAMYAFTSKISWPFAKLIYLGNNIALAACNVNGVTYIYRSSDGGASWLPINFNDIIYSIA